MTSVLRWYFGGLSAHHREKLIYLSCTFAFTTTAMVLLRYASSKTFMTMVGPDYGTTGNAVVFAFAAGLVALCSYALDRMTQYRVIMALSFGYVVALGLTAHLLGNPFIGLDALSVGPHRYLGWWTMMLVKSFGLLILSLLWGFFSTTNDERVARSGIFFIVAGMLGGSWLGSYLLNVFSIRGIPTIVAIGATVILFIPLTLTLLARAECGDNSECRAFEYDHYAKDDAGIFSGLRMLFPGCVGVCLLGAWVFTEGFSRLAQRLDVLAVMNPGWFSNLPLQLNLLRALQWGGACRFMLTIVVALTVMGWFMRTARARMRLLIWPGFMAVSLLALYFDVLLPSSVRDFGFMLFVIAHKPSLQLLYYKASFGMRVKGRLWINLIAYRFFGPVGKWLIKSLVIPLNPFSFGVVLALLFTLAFFAEQLSAAKSRA